jgi:hypothetical protein
MAASRALPIPSMLTPSTAACAEGVDQHEGVSSPVVRRRALWWRRLGAAHDLQALLVRLTTRA